MAYTATTRAEAFDSLHKESAEDTYKCWGIAVEDGEQQPVSRRSFHLCPTGSATRLTTTLRRFSRGCRSRLADSTSGKPL